MTSKQIEMVLEVAKSLNFTKAAEKLYVSQPTLTYQIKQLEEELRFAIFDRSNKAISLTPAGKAFVDALRKISLEMKQAIEEAQNYSEKYDDDIVISYPYRSALPLPKAMKEFEKKYPSTLISFRFGWVNRISSFLNGEVDIYFDDYENLKSVKGIKLFEAYKSRIYLICKKDDPLANKELIEMNDLIGRTLMVGGGSQLNLRKVQSRVLDTLHIPFFNSDNHDVTLTNIEAGRAIVLAPGFLHDHNDGFAWIPFDCPETIDCRLAVKESEGRESVYALIDILKKIIGESDPSSL